MSWLDSSPVPLHKISDEEYATIQNSAELIVADLLSPKVMRKPNGNFLKFFRRKRMISSAMFAPYAIRFVNNAFRLKELAIPTISPVQIWHCPTKGMHIVEYEPLTGKLLRGALEKDNSGDLLEKTACFIARLHDKGIYFRSLHFENIILHEGQLGLIDIADMKIYPQPLNRKLRERNFQHFLRYPRDNAIIKKYGLPAFIDKYHDCESTLSD